MLLDTTLGRTPLDEKLDRRKDPYLTIHTIRKRHTCHWRDSKPQSLQGNGCKPTLRPPESADISYHNSTFNQLLLLKKYESPQENKKTGLKDSYANGEGVESEIQLIFRKMVYSNE